MLKKNSRLKEEIKKLEIRSSAFKNHDQIPSKYTSDGANINPPLSINNLPKETKSMVLIIENQDAPIYPWVHWLVWNIPPISKIKENSIPGIEGRNDFSKHNYGGPFHANGTDNRYLFKINALNKLMYINPPVTKLKLEKAISQHIIGYGELIGTYKKEE